MVWYLTQCTMHEYGMVLNTVYNTRVWYGTMHVQRNEQCTIIIESIDDY